MIVDGRNRVLPHQSRVLSSWADRSVKWLLLDVLVDATAHERSKLYLRTAGAGPAGDKPDNLHLRGQHRKD